MTFADLVESARRYLRGEINGDQWWQAVDGYTEVLLKDRDPAERETGNRMRDAARWIRRPE